MEGSGNLVIWVLRHAKAASNGPSGDVSRPLTGRGRRQADSVREHLQTFDLGTSEVLDDGELLPTLVLCSPAVRARETAEIVMPALPEARLQFEEVLYDEDADGVVEWLRQLDPVESRLMVVGHNPTLHEICLLLAEPVYCEELESAGLPTAGLVRLDVPLPPPEAGASAVRSWKALSPGVAGIGHRFVPGF